MAYCSLNSRISENVNSRVCEEAIRVTGNEAISHPTGCHFLVVDEETDGHEEGRKCEDPPCLQVNRVCLDIAVVQEQQDGATAQAGSGAGGISDDV